MLSRQVRQVLNTVSEVTGLDIDVIEEPSRQGDPATLVASADRPEQILGWTPQRPDLEDIIASAWQWVEGAD